MKTALLLAGGGSRGILGVGQLLAFRDLGLDYAEIRTSSVGSLNALLFHTKEYDKLAELWLNIKPGKVYKNLGLLDLALCYKRKWVHDSTPLNRLIRENVNFPALLANPRDFWVNTTDLTNRCAFSREVKSFSNKEDLVTFAFASASPPIYFPTVQFEGRELCDSGVVNNYSIADAINSGCETLILMLPTKPAKGRPAKDILELHNQVLSLSMQSDMERESKAIIRINKIIDLIHSAVQESKCQVVLEDENFPKRIKLIIVYPEQDPAFEFLDFNYKGLNRKELIMQGYSRAKEVLQKWL